MKTVIAEAVEGIEAFRDLVLETVEFTRRLFVGRAVTGAGWLDEQRNVRQLRGMLRWEGDLEQMRKD